MCKKILVIDDSESVRLHVSNILKEAGYEVVTAIHGNDALAKLDGSKYRLFLCDVMMPEMDGLQFVKVVKEEKAYSEYRFVPIVMLTTINDEKKKFEGQTSGVKAWLVKPIVPDMILKAIEKLSKE